MKTAMLKVGVALALAFGGSALADSASSNPPSPRYTVRPGAQNRGTQARPVPMQKVRPGREDEAIAPLFTGSYTWTGQIPAGVTAANAPATTTQGQASCRKILDGLWYACDITDRMQGGEAMHGHLAVGYDRGAKAYRGVMLDNMGSSLAPLDGTLDGKRFALETPTDVTMMGQRMKDRITFNFTDPNNIKFTDEHKLPGKDWQVFETSTLKRAMRPAQARTPRGR